MKNHKKINKGLKLGFTLIELLVVVAIIGALAAVVLAALNNSRVKGSDSKIKSQLKSMQNQAELYTGTGTAVVAVTPCSTTAGTLFETANNGFGLLFDGITLANTRCASALGQPSSGTNWAVAAQISTGAWCVDSTGWSSDKAKTGTKYTSILTSAIAAATTTCI